MHATRQGPRNAIAISETLVDGTIAAFHDDRYAEALFPALSRKFLRLSDDELRRALDHPVGPLFSTPAIRPFGESVQFSPADDRCIIGEVEIRGACRRRSGPS